ncbi:MAG: YraN family protein [Ginsengibacter sp.]
MAHHNITGNLGEEMAVNYLADKGYTILNRNWRHAHWEIDIIATYKNKIHFIEVKTRRTNTFGFPEDDVSKKKMRFLISSAEEFLYQNPGWKLIQFDILSITLSKDNSAAFFLIEDVSI